MKELKSVMAIVALALIGTSSGWAQSYYDDDIYYNPEKAKKEKLEKQRQKKQQSVSSIYNSSLPGSDTYTVFTSNTRDVDEYNRRNVKPSVVRDSAAISGKYNSFAYTNRIERFYNPDVVSGSNDDELQEYYYSSQIEPETTTINLIIEPDYGWYSPFYYSSWYNPWYNPWYYNSWGYWDPWYGPGWWGPSYAWNWGWGPSWSLGWGPSWGCGWGPSWGGSWNPGHIHNYHRPTGAMITHRPAGNRGGSVSSGRRPNVTNQSSGRRPVYNQNHQTETVRPVNSDPRRGGNSIPTNNYNNSNNYNNYNNSNSGNNRNSGSSWGSGSRGGSSFGSGGSVGGGSRSGGGMRGTGGRRR